MALKSKFQLASPRDISLKIMINGYVWINNSIVYKDIYLFLSTKDDILVKYDKNDYKPILYNKNMLSKHIGPIRILVTDDFEDVFSDIGALGRFSSYKYKVHIRLRK